MNKPKLTLASVALIALIGSGGSAIAQTAAGVADPN